MSKAAAHRATDARIPRPDGGRVPTRPATLPKATQAPVPHERVIPPATPKRHGRKVLTSRVWPAVLVLALLGTAVMAAVTVTYLNNSNVSVSTIEAPVRYAAGTETANRYVTGWSLSNNETYFSATVKGVPEANLTVNHLFKFTNHDTDAHGVTLTLTGGAVANANIETFKIHFKDAADDSTVAVWDLKASASQAFAGMAASKTYYGVVYIHLASGAGNNNVSEALAVSLTVS